RAVPRDARRSREFRPEEAGEEQSAQPAWGRFEPGREVVILGGLVAHRSPEAREQKGKTRTVNLEPFLGALERIFRVRSLDGVAPLARVDPGGGDAEPRDVGANGFEVFGMAVEVHDSLAPAADEVDVAVAKNEAEDLAQVGQRRRGVTQRKQVTFLQ